MPHLLPVHEPIGLPGGRCALVANRVPPHRLGAGRRFARAVALPLPPAHRAAVRVLVFLLRLFPAPPAPPTWPETEVERLETLAVAFGADLAGASAGVAGGQNSRTIDSICNKTCSASVKRVHSAG